MCCCNELSPKEDFHESSSMQGPGAGPMAGEEKDAGVRSLIDVNGLAYRMTPGLSVSCVSGMRYEASTALAT